MSAGSLNRDQIRSILSLYHLEELEDFGGAESRSAKAAYWVVVHGSRYLLRIAEGKRISDMIYEKELLLFLRDHGLPVPRIVPNVAQGSFIPWSRRGRYVSLFEDLPGRSLGVFEVRSRHARALGEVLGEMHAAARAFRRVRASGRRVDGAEVRLRRLERGLRSGRLRKPLGPDVAFLTSVHERRGRLASTAEVVGPLPEAVTTIHGDVGLSSVRFSNDRIVGFMSFESSHTGAPIEDVARAILAWCWVPSPDQHGGPRGAFHRGRVRALLEGYATSRSLARDELRAIPDALRGLALDLAVERLELFELRRLRTLRYLDYRHPLEQLRLLEDDGAESLLEGRS